MVLLAGAHSGVNGALGVGGSSLLPRAPGVVALALAMGGQRLEEAGDGVEAVLGARVGPRQGPRGGARIHGLQVGDDGVELEVLPVHGDVGSQGLQVQVTQIPLQNQVIKGLWNHSETSGVAWLITNQTGRLTAVHKRMVSESDRVFGPCFQACTAHVFII